ncbi:HAD-IB family phosphatase [Chroococcus sp. FPU101]|uniref:HAD-IB family phosphatase n=1 Tax=Chroococcus sp. FPU101 TaxID=1974212 RepID=UPI001A8C0C68|nr:HAD-IB family phosphatase [Chroococcus sp. FPU101]
MPKVVFCDFDGTITAIETFAGMLKEFAPELSAELMPKMYRRQITLRAGVRQILESIPSTCYSDILAYAQDKPIRSGLAEFMDFLEVQKVPFVVVSGGLREMVETVLKREGLLKKVFAIFAVDLNINYPNLKVCSDFEDQAELVAKVKVMAQYSVDESIAIGDSLTDINMASAANLVFARDRLIDYMEAEHKPYIPWNDFTDIQNYLSKYWHNE